MKNKLMINIFFSIVIFSCNAQYKKDLSELNINQDVNELIKDKKKTDDYEIATSLPGYEVFDIKDFSFGDVKFTNGGALGENDPVASSIYFLVESEKKPVLVGWKINLEKTDEATQLKKYLTNKYGAGTILTPDPKPEENKLFGYPARYWKDVKSGITLVYAGAYSEKNGKQALSSTLFMIKTGQKPKAEGFATVLDKLIKSFKS